MARYKRKTRKFKQDEYERKYSDIPLDYYERLSWLYDELNITPRDEQDIINPFEKSYLCLQLFDNGEICK